MFLSDKEIKDKIKSIIVDDVDNDIVFVVGHKGIGKKQLLNELYGEAKFNRDIIVADGKQIPGNALNIAKCFIQGIVQYVKLNNCIAVRRDLCHIIGTNNINIAERVRFIFINRKKIDFSTILSILSQMSINQLKETYYKIAGRTPLIIISSAMFLLEAEVKYLCSLSSDSFGTQGARVTFVLGIRANTNSVNQMVKVINAMEERTWILPLLPKITDSYDSTNPKALAKLTIADVGEITSVESFQNKLSSSDVYFEMFNIVRQLTDQGLSPRTLFVLANQEISFSSYDYLAEITRKIYNSPVDSYDNRIILPKDGKLLWLDALSYYYSLLLQIDEAIIHTQRFFLGLISEVLGQNSICYSKPKRNAFIIFIKDASSKKKNELAQSFSDYYSDFAMMAKVIFSRKVYEYNNSEEALISLQILDRVTIDFCKENLQALSAIYENTQLCSLIDVGMDAVYSYITSLKPGFCIHDEDKEIIQSFFQVSMSEAYKWSDVTIIDSIIKIEQLLIKRGEAIRFYYHESFRRSSEASLFGWFLDQLNEYNIDLGDINMKGTIFLSYTYSNSKIADAFDTQLQIMAYDVKRDIREVDAWSDLKEYMKRIRSEDNVVFLVSDDFLRKDNCMYEVMQFLKDDSRMKNAFPVAIEFSEKQKTQRESEGKATSMFSPEYLAEIVKFWQDRVKKLKSQYEELLPENAAEFAMEYRERKNMAQAASEFIHEFLGKMLVGAYRIQKQVNNKRISEIVVTIDSKIQKL